MQNRPRLSADLTVLIVWPLLVMGVIWLMVSLASLGTSLFTLWQLHR